MALALPLLLTLGLLCALSAFLSLSEASFLAVNKVRLRHLMQRGSAPAKAAYHLLTKLDRLIATLLVCNNVVNVVISVLGTLACMQLFGQERGPIIASVILTIVLLVFAEITPKLFAAGHADRVALAVVWPVNALIQLMRPVVWLFNQTSHAIIRLLGGKHLPRAPIVTEEELKVMIEMGREAGVVAERELRMLHRIFEFDDTLVKDVMVPRQEIAAIEIGETPEAVIDRFIEEGHSRIPVYRGNLDRIEGVIYSRDLLAMVRHGGLFVLADLVRPIYRVPETKRVAELLTDFQRMQLQIAVVQSHPQRATAGLVTVEDLVEEIVGDLHEEAPASRRPNLRRRLRLRPRRRKR